MNIRVYKEKKKFDSQITNLKDKIQGLQNKNNVLKQNIAKTDDKDYIEKIAREKLDLQIKNEKVITFIMPKLQQKEEINTNSGFLNFRTWLGWLSNGWQWVKNKF